MARLFGFALIVAAGYLLFNHIDLGSSRVRTDGNTIVVDAGQLESRFSGGGPFSGTYMLFGANRDSHPNSMTDAYLAGLPIAEARLIHSAYPDFHRCNSPGAEGAKRRVQDFHLVAASSGIERTLGKAADLFHERLRGDGPRTCVTLTGRRLSIVSVKIPEAEMDVTSEVTNAFAGSPLYLVESAAIEDCQALLD